MNAFAFPHLHASKKEMDSSAEECDFFNEIRDEFEFIDEMLELEETFGHFSVPRRHVTDRINPLEYYRSEEFR